MCIFVKDERCCFSVTYLWGRGLVMLTYQGVGREGLKIKFFVFFFKLKIFVLNNLNRSKMHFHTYSPSEIVFSIMVPSTYTATETTIQHL